MLNLLMFYCLSFGSRGAAADDASAARILKARTPHEALGVAPGATKDEIKAARNNLAKQYYQRANQGDREATEVMQRLNSAVDNLTKERIDPRTSSSYQGGGDSGGGGARDSSGWSAFSERMRNAKTVEERAAVRADQVRVARNPAEFAAIAAAGTQLGVASPETVAFARAHMAEFVRMNPTLVDLNTLAARGVSAENQQAIYRAAIAHATSPDQMIQMIAPSLSMNQGGGQGWIKNLKVALEAELPKFFELAPNAEQLRRMRSALNLAYRAEGEAMFFKAGKVAAKRNEAAAAAGAGVRPRSSQNLFWRLMGKLGGKLLAIDPTLISGVAREKLAEGEGNALAEDACPPAFKMTGGHVLSPEYLRLLALKGRESAEATAADCDRKTPGQGQKFLRAVDADREAAKQSFKAPGQRVRCRVEGPNKDPLIELTLVNGQRGELRFDGPAKLASLELTPQAGVANQNYFLRQDFAAPADQSVSYCAYGPRAAAPRSELRVIKESETSFLARATCAIDRCDHVGFIENTTNADSNVFSTDGIPDEKRPFGQLDKSYLLDTAKTYQLILGQIRSVGAKERSFANVCRALGGDPPAVDAPKTAAPATESGAPPPTSAQ